MNHLYLVRHADAGERGKFPGPDTLRPLSERGTRQARWLVTALAAYPLSAVWSSPAIRCVETVEPLAAARHLSVREDTRLLEGHEPGDTLQWLTELLHQGSVAASTHGDLIPAILDLLRSEGCRLPSELRWKKGSCWLIEHDSGWVAARYLAPD
jgi:broad specificity phosphatase PhoE